MERFRKNEIDKRIVNLEDNCGACERIFTTPVPLVYTRLTARFLSFWLLTMPLALWEPFKTSWNHVAMIPAAGLLALFLFGIEELAIQLEEPFSIFNLQELAEISIGKAVYEFADWHDANDILDYIALEDDLIMSASASRKALYPYGNLTTSFSNSTTTSIPSYDS